MLYDNNSNGELEIETMSLFTDKLNSQGLHLGGSKRTDELFYNDGNGVIVDTKAYFNGYNLSITQTDEIICIEENKNKGYLNPNRWCKISKEMSQLLVIFLFLLNSNVINKNNIQYIKSGTNYDSGVISSKKSFAFC